MQKYNTIELQIPQPGVAAVILNRPEVHNAFNKSMIDELTEVFENLSRGSEIRVICLRAHGTNFCAGADLKWMKASTEENYDEVYSGSVSLYNMFNTIAKSPQPLIAQVQGSVYGGGLGLLAVCDYIQAATNSAFSFSELKLGLLPATIAPFVMKKIGYSASKAYMLSARKFSSEEALRIGLIHHISDNEDDFSSLIGDFLQCAPQASSNCKKMLDALNEGQSDERHYSAGLITRARLSVEGQQGMKALLEKRKSPWTK